MNQKAYLMIGKIGSGKTSWARMIARTNLNVIRVSGDDIRSMIKDRYTFDLQLEPMVSEMVTDLALRVLSARKNVVIDDRHLDLKERERICAKIKANFGNSVDVIYVWVKCDEATGLTRRLTVPRGYSSFEWKQIVKKHNEEFVIPSKEENDFVSDLIEVDNYD